MDWTIYRGPSLATRWWGESGWSIEEFKGKCNVLFADYAIVEKLTQQEAFILVEDISLLIKKAISASKNNG